MKRILHSSVVCVIFAIFLTGYHTLNKCQREIVDSKCIVSGCYFGMILYMNNKAQVDAYCASQIERPERSNVIEFFKEPIKPDIEINEINPKGKIR